MKCHCGAPGQEARVRCVKGTELAMLSDAARCLSCFPPPLWTLFLHLLFPSLRTPVFPFLRTPLRTSVPAGPCLVLASVPISPKLDLNPWTQPCLGFRGGRQGERAWVTGSHPLPLFAIAPWQVSLGHPGLRFTLLRASPSSSVDPAILYAS